MEDNLLKHFPESIERHKGYIKGFEQDIVTLAEHTPKVPQGGELHCDFIAPFTEHSTMIYYRFNGDWG